MKPSPEFNPPSPRASLRARGSREPNFIHYTDRIHSLSRCLLAKYRFFGQDDSNLNKNRPNIGSPLCRSRGGIFWLGQGQWRRPPWRKTMLRRRPWHKRRKPPPPPNSASASLPTKFPPPGAFPPPSPVPPIAPSA